MFLLYRSVNLILNSLIELTFVAQVGRNNNDTLEDTEQLERKCENSEEITIEEC